MMMMTMLSVRAIWYVTFHAGVPCSVGVAVDRSGQYYMDEERRVPCRSDGLILFPVIYSHRSMLTSPMARSTPITFYCASLPIFGHLATARKR